MKFYFENYSRLLLILRKVNCGPVFIKIVYFILLRVLHKLVEGCNLMVKNKIVGKVEYLERKHQSIIQINILCNNKSTDCGF